MMGGALREGKTHNGTGLETKGPIPGVKKSQLRIREKSTKTVQIWNKNEK